MNFVNKFKKYSKIRFAAVLCIAGLILSVIAGIIFFRPQSETEKVSAEIVNIEENSNGEETGYTVTVTYEADGKTFTNELGAYESGWSVGDTIECHYEKGNPADISYGSGKMTAVIVFAAGVLAFLYGVFSLVKSVRTPSGEFAQYNRIDEAGIDAEKKAGIENNAAPLQDYIFHFTGKMNQSYVMKDKFGKEVYCAICNGIKLIKDTDFEFKNSMTGAAQLKKIGHTVTLSMSSGSPFGGSISSAFTIDGKNCWDILADMGYGFDFSLKGLKGHYAVKHYGVSVGDIEAAGTEVLNEKYEGNALAKMPAQGIFRLSCSPSEIEGFFMICFCLARTENTLS